MLAGVSQGLALRFDIPVLLIRIGFVLLTFTGGLGLVLYAAGWFLIRSEDEPTTPAERFFSGAGGARSWLGIGIVFIAILILLDNFTFISGGLVWAIGLLVVGVLLYTGDLSRLSPNKADGDLDISGGEASAVATDDHPPAAGGPPSDGTPPIPAATPPALPPSARKTREKSILGRLTLGAMVLGTGVLALLDNTTDLVQPGFRHYVALAVTILGVGLLVGTFAGRARWLILVAVIMVPTLVVSPAFEWDWTDEAVERQFAPTTFSELQTTYVFDIGGLEIDLRDLPWDGENVAIDAHVDAGQIQVFVPPGVRIQGTATADVGQVSGPRERSAGIGDLRVEFNTPGTQGAVELNLSVDVGDIDVDIR